MITVKPFTQGELDALALRMKDPAGTSNIIVCPLVLEKFRREVLAGRLLAMKGQI